MKKEQNINENEINTDSKVKNEEVENNNENEINTDSKPKIINEEKEIKIKNENENEINTESKKKNTKNQNQKPKQNKQNKKKLNKNQSQFKSIFDDFFDFPLKISKILKDISIRDKFEEEKRLSVPNLREFFEMSEKKKSKWDNIPVTNIQKFFEMRPRKINNGFIRNFLPMGLLL